MDHPSDSGQPKSVRMLGDLGSGTGPVSGPVSKGKKVAHGVILLTFVTKCKIKELIGNEDHFSDGLAI